MSFCGYKKVFINLCLKIIRNMHTVNVLKQTSNSLRHAFMASIMPFYLRQAYFSILFKEKTRYQSLKWTFVGKHIISYFKTLIEKHEMKTFCIKDDYHVEIQWKCPEIVKKVPFKHRIYVSSIYSRFDGLFTSKRHTFYKIRLYARNMMK